MKIIKLILYEIYYFLKSNKIVTLLLLLSCYTTHKVYIGDFQEWVGSKICFAFITSSIFYILVTYLPKRKISNSSYELIKDKLYNIYSSMDYIISILEYSLKSEQANGNSDVIFKDEYIYAKINYYKNGELLTNVANRRYNIYKDLSEEQNMIIKSIVGINNLPCTINLDFKLLQILSSITTDVFLQRIQFHKKTNDIKNDWGIEREWNILSSMEDEDFVKFKELRDQLGKYNFVKLTYSCEKISDKEIEHDKKFLKEMEDNNPEAFIIHDELNKD